MAVLMSLEENLVCVLIICTFSLLTVVFNVHRSNDQSE